MKFEALWRMPSGAPVFESKGVRTPASCRKEQKPKSPKPHNIDGKFVTLNIIVSSELIIIIKLMIFVLLFFQLYYIFYVNIIDYV